MKVNFILTSFVISNIIGITISKDIINLSSLKTGMEDKEISQETEIAYTIEPENIYHFIITNEDYMYSFSSDKDGLFYVNKDEDTREQKPNGSFFKKGDEIYINLDEDLTEKINITVTPFPIYKRLNSFETIIENQYFFIKAEEESILYFDSLDRNCSIFISETFNKSILEDDQRIIGQILKINESNIYMVKNILYSNISVSNFKKYFYPLDLTPIKKIDVIDGETNFIYLQKDNSYTLDFQNTQMKKMLKLSTKTKYLTVVNIKGANIEKTLNNESPYLELDNSNGEIILEVKENDAFIEFLYELPEALVLESEMMENYKVEKNPIIIPIPITQKDFGLLLNSNESLKFSLSFGLSNNTPYSYYSKSNKEINIEKNEVLLFYSPFKNLDVLENEFLSLVITFEKNDYQEINITYRQFSKIDKLLDEDMSEEVCKLILGNLTEVLELYIYTDIAKNPPEIEGHPNYHHRKIDLIKEISNVNTTNRKYYEFNQEIQKILTTTKDLHFNIMAFSSPNGTKLGNYVAYLPFYLVIKKHNNIPRIFIEKSKFFDNFDEETKQFIESHLNISIKTINEIDPFDYIQNWSPFESCKNYHSQFTYMLHTLDGFYLSNFPLNYTDFKNEYVFDDNQMIKFSYQIIERLNAGKEFNDFDEYLIQTLKKHRYSLKIPLINEVEEKYLILKGLKIKEETPKEEKIDWNITLEDPDKPSYFFKCRVDNEKKVNVIVQSTFSLNYQKFIGIILDCGDLFYTNDYPIFIIETLNGGGYAVMHMIMHQIFQLRTTNRAYYSFKSSPSISEILKNEILEYQDINKCETITSYDNFTIETDYYANNDLNITHYRTNIIDYLSTSFRKAMNEYREKYNKSEKIKKPTDILIFTDSFSYSATSGLIKNFQNTGSAIIVGYLGNPKKEGVDLFDASQSSSSVNSYQGTDLFFNMRNLGYEIMGITFSETFDISTTQEKNPIPREYTFDPVDERVDIYSEYTDELYGDFIDKGLEIHKKYNEQKECNPKNKRLVLHDENCPIEGLENVYGGRKCNSEGKWDMNQCHLYYCKIGYYYDSISDSCVEECPYENSKSYLLYKKDFSKEISINKNMTYEFFLVNKDDIYYIFESSEDCIEYYPRISIFPYYNELKINKDKNSEKDINLKINSLASNISFDTFESDLFLDGYYLFDETEKVLFKPSEEYVIYLKGSIDMPNEKVKMAVMDNNMTFEDILNVNVDYFSKYQGELYHLEKDVSYVFNFEKNNIKEQFHIFVCPIEINNIITFTGIDYNYLYLQKDKNYTINIEGVPIKRLIKLSRNTLDAEIVIPEINILSSEHPYYPIPENKSVSVNLTVNKEDAFIEFLYEIPNTKVIDLENLEFSLEDEFNLIKIPKKYANNNFIFELKGDENTTFSLFRGYSIPPYSDYRKVSDINQIKEKNYKFKVNKPYNKDIKLLDDEFYTVMIQKSKGSLKVILNIENDKIIPDKKDKLKTWQLILIIVCSIILLLLIIIIIIICRKRKQLSNKEIEGEMHGLTEMNEKIILD